MKTNTNAIIFGIAIVASSIFLGKAYTDRSKADGEIRVTGLGKTDFSSDLIVWEGEFSSLNKDLKLSYITLEKNKATVNRYLVEKGIETKQLVYSARLELEVYSPLTFLLCKRSQNQLRSPL